MALDETYATLSDLKGYLSITSDADNGELADALSSASRDLERYCSRQFNDAGSASARVYATDSPCVVDVDDFSTVDGLVVRTDEDGDGVYETTWPTSDYQVEPLNGIVDGQAGWPYWTIRAVGGRAFPLHAEARVQVTARWGWAAVPAPVKQSCLILAAETYKLREAPFGVAGFGDYGVVRIRSNPVVATKLAPYRRTPVLVA